MMMLCGFDELLHFLSLSSSSSSSKVLQGMTMVRGKRNLLVFLRVGALVAAVQGYKDNRFRTT